MNSKNQIQELADLAPIGMNIVGEIEGIKIYANEKIRDTVKDWISYSPSTKNIKDTISEGIDSGKILVGYTTKSFISHLFRRVAKWTTHIFDEGIVLGWYSPKVNRIVILLDMNVNILGHQLRSIPPILSHELCHMAAGDNISLYHSSTVNKYLIPFYIEIIRGITKDNNITGDNRLSKTLYQLMKSSEERTSNSNVEDSLKIWKDYFTSLTGSNDKGSEFGMAMMLPYLRFVTRTLSSRYYNESYEVMKYYYNGYRKLNVRKPERVTLACQEARYPSEVICITNQFNVDSTVARLINNINMSRI